MAKILEGVRILDFTHMVAGPLATMILADMGAEVIKIEPPEGESARHIGDTRIGGESDYFLSCNRGKKSVVLDMKTPAGMAAIRALAASSDVVVENFRDGVADRLGVGYEALAKDNPALVYCSISGFGPEGAGRPALDPVVQALSGLMQLTGTPESGPLKLGILLADFVTPLMGVIGILGALIERRNSGQGQKLDCTMLDACIFSMITREGGFFATGKQPARLGNQHFQIVPANTYAAADGREIMIFAHTEKHWRLLVEAIGDPALRDDPRFETNAKRLRHRDEVNRLLADAIRREPRDRWLDKLGAAGVIHAPIRDFAEVFSDPAVTKHMLAEQQHPKAGPLRTLRTPIRYARSPLEPVRPPPLLGEHTQEVLRALGRLR